MATKSSKIHVYIFMVLIFFLCLLSFSVGTFVGKTVTENELKQNQAEVFNNINDREVASVEKEVFDEAPEEKVSDEETLSKEEIDALANEFDKAEEETTAAAPTESTAANTTTESSDPNLDSVVDANAPVTKTTKNDSPIEDVTKRIANDESATEDFAKPRKPTAVMPRLNPSLGQYTVQLASYTSEKEAQAHSEKLKGQGYSAFFISAKVRGKEWYRVSVGLFDNNKKADAFRKKFVKRTNLEAAIVQKVVHKTKQ